MRHPLSRIMTAILVAALVILSGCDLASSREEGALTGYWKSVHGDGFEITGNLFSGYHYTQFDDADKSISFAGTVANEPDFDATSGYIIIRITDTGNWGKTEGAYLGIHWENLSDSLVAASSAYKAGSAYNNGIESLSEALAEYTVKNGYFGYYGDYQKQ